eukprot:TRINITY_DN1345_c0_g1_i1.p1 TRINITY_DN1345_c0_g1~~TRINITY_DN1345_c0_g1_i1.p1  ORF type:complete len:156 (+),score=58.36 TRINITY_DN1345_c0_g1_i1:132-599(+)
MAINFATQRLLRELKDFKTEQVNDLTLTPLNDELTEWKAIIKGPIDTPFTSASFELLLVIPENYPMSPPKGYFKTKIFHPNVHWKNGEICLDLLSSAWSSAYTLQSVCRAIILLLSQPEASSPLNCDAGNLIRAGDMRGYSSVAKMYSKLYGLKI